MDRFLLVCLGGAFGSGARYLVSGWALRALGPAFPFGTLAVNVAGSFFISLLMHLGLAAEVFSPNVRLLLTTGVLGGFTTYSTFNYETLKLLEEGAWGLGAANLLATVASCLVAGYLGLAAGRFAAGP